MNKMLDDYDHLLNIDPLSQYDIPVLAPQEHLYAIGRKKESLNGTWRFSVDVYNTFLRKKFFEEQYVDSQGRDIPVDCDFDQWECMSVPSNWNCQHEKYFYFEGTGIYTRKFHYVPESFEERVFLRIGAANHTCRIWINKQLVARHIGGFTPFTVEITQYLLSNAKNRVILEVNNTRQVEQVPSINYDWFNYGGVFRDIDIFRTPKNYIRDVFVSLEPNGCYDTLAFEITVDGTSAGKQVRIEIEELSLICILVLNEQGVARGTFAAKPELWSPMNPKLYKVVVCFDYDMVEDYIGFRQIQTEGNKIFLNGSEIRLKGVCCHEEIPNNGRTMSFEDQQKTLIQAKELGCNIMRLSHYPHNESMARIADELGIMLWEEIPVYWALCFDNPETLSSAQSQMTELVMRDRNRASVVLWGVGNENPDTQARLDFMRTLIAICKKLDSSRLTTAACLVNIDSMSVQDRLSAYIDVVSINEYYGWYYRDYEGLANILDNTMLDKPLVISETGSDAQAGHHGMDEELFTEEHQAKMYRKQLELTDGRIQGIFPWILYDFRSPIRMNNWQKGFNRKGLISFDREHKKLAYNILKNYYQGD